MALVLTLSSPSGTPPGCSSSPSPSAQPPPGAVPFSIKHAGVAAQQQARQPADGGGGGVGSSLYRRTEAFLLSVNAFTSQGNPNLFTRDSMDSLPPHRPAEEPAEPSRFAEARRAAAAAAVDAAGGSYRQQ